MTRLVLTNTNCSWNKGSAAQVASALKILREFIPDADFSLISYCPELDSKGARASNIKIVGYSHRNRHKFALFLFHLCVSLLRCTLWTMLRKIVVDLPFLMKKRYLQTFAAADAIIDLSGDSYSDSKGGISLINSICLLIPMLLRKPIVFFSQSIGPFRKLTLPLARFCLNRASLIIVREEITRDYLVRVGIKSPIYLTADCAFVLERVSYERAWEILADAGVSLDSRPLVGISANAMLQDKNNRYVNLLAQLTDYIVGKLDAQVVFVPHVVSMAKDGGGDDRDVAERIYEIIINRDKIKLIKNEYSPQELKGVIGLCDVFIGSRMHANIAALSSSVPTLAIAWSHKYFGIMQAVGQGKYVCDFTKVTFEQLESKIDDLWSNRDKIREALKLKVEAQKQLALFSGKLVKDLVHSLSGQ